MLPRAAGWAAGEWGRLCVNEWLNGPANSKHNHFLHRLQAERWYFYTHFYWKGVITMTMLKREVNSIWARVRADVDVDDLIFNYEDTHSREDEPRSER